MLNLFFILLPAFVYGLLIYLALPYKSMDFRKGLGFLFFGSLSISILSIFQNSFPEWYQVAATDRISQAFNLMFFRVALIEEVMKFIAFYLVAKLYGKSDDEHPTSFMFYGAMSYLSFAIIENSQYLVMVGPEVLLIRSFTSTIMHMLTGLFLGYWMAISQTKYENSAYDELTKNRPRIRNFTYILIAIFINIIYHGLYNFNLESNGIFSFPLMIMILVFGLALAKYYSDRLISLKKDNSLNK